MWIYLLIIVWIVLVFLFYCGTDSGISERSKTRKKIKYSMLVGVPLWFIMAFRAYSVGNDTIIYIRHFREIQKYSIKGILLESVEIMGRETMEKGYLVFEKVLSLLSNQDIFYMIVVSTILIGSVLYFVITNSEMPVLSLYIYVAIGLYTFMLTGMRQSIAMCICLIALEQAKKRKLLWFIALVLMACTFHKSAVIFGVVYLLVNQRLTIGKGCLIFGATFVGIRYLEPIQEFFNEQLDYEYEIESTGNGQIFLIVMICVLLFTLWKYKENVRENQNMIVMYNMQIICTILWVLRLFSRTVERPSFYFMFGIVALIPNTICRFQRASNRKLIVTGIIILFGLLFVYRMLGNTAFVPYEFIWSN